MNSLRQGRLIGLALCASSLLGCLGQVDAMLSPDAGVDGGLGAGVDAGATGGSDAGSQTGGDGGSVTGVDAGPTAGGDAGATAGGDAGATAGSDAGAPMGVDGGSNTGADAGVVCAVTLAAGANIATAVASAAPGATICLGSGAYPGFTLNAISRSPRVTVVALVTRAATTSFVIQGNSNGITLDGLTLSSGLITGASTRNITVRNSAFTGQLRIDGVRVADPQLLFDNNTHNNITAATAPNARFHLSYSGVATGKPVATIRNSVFDGSCSDGIQSGVPVAIIHNQFKNMLVGNCPNDPHTDAVQFYGGPFAGTVVSGNYFVNNEQVLAAFDGVDNLLITDNVFDPGTSAPRPCQIELYSDTNSIIRHNTVLSRGGNGSICLDHKATDPVGTGTVIDNNIAREISSSNGSTAASSTNNLLQTGASSGNLAGAPTYVGGALPSSWAGFALAAGSLGKGVGTNPAASDIGANTFSP